LFYSDNITKGFLNASSYIVKNTGRLYDYQDPTFLGFSVRIMRPSNPVNDIDNMPHGLFTLKGEKDPYSAIYYLKQRGETMRANYLKEFESIFLDIVKNYPWYFVKISGIADLWKIDQKQNWRGKEKKITIETLESIDMRMTYAMDLYRKAVYDVEWMRWTVPENHRYFQMEIVISEIRMMQAGVNTFNDAVSPGFNLSNGVENPNTNAGRVPWSAGTFLKFRLEHCEFDPFSEGPAYLESVSQSPDTMASNKIIIKVGKIREQNVYGLLGAIIEDTLLYKDYTKDNIYDPSPFSTNKKPIDLSIIQNGLSNNGYGTGDIDREKKFNEFIESRPNVFSDNRQIQSSGGLLENVIGKFAPKGQGNNIANNIKLTSLDKQGLGNLDKKISNTNKFTNAIEKIGTKVFQKEQKKIENSLSIGLTSRVDFSNPKTILTGLETIGNRTLESNISNLPQKINLNTLLDKNKSELSKTAKPLDKSITSNKNLQTFLNFTDKKVDAKTPK
jgi:hypothetical protein